MTGPIHSACISAAMAAALALPLVAARAEVQQLPAVARATAGLNPAMAERLQLYADQVASLQGEWTARQQRYGGLAVPTSDEAKRVQAELEGARAELDNLKRARDAEVKRPEQIEEGLRSLVAKIQRLEMRLAPGASPARAAEIPERAGPDQLELVLKELLVRVQHLEDLIAKMPRPGSPRGLQHEVSLAGKKPIGLMLLGQRLIPRKLPYFKIVDRGFARMADGRQIPAARVARAQNGQTLDEALKPNGLLTQLINETKPAESYFKFFVCPDAIDSFERVRDAVAARGFAYAWDTDRDAPFVIPTQPIGPADTDPRNDWGRNPG